MSFDAPVNRRNTHCVKWDGMEAIYGVPPDEGLAMWVADMEFRPPEAVRAALSRMNEHGVFGYFGEIGPYLRSIIWWMKNRASAVRSSVGSTVAPFRR